MVTVRVACQCLYSLLFFALAFAIPEPAGDWISSIETEIRDNTLDHFSELLLSPHLNTPCMGDGTLTAVHYAAKNGAKTGTLRALLQGGADFKSPHANTRTTAVHFAAREGNTETLEAILTILAERQMAEDAIEVALSQRDEHGNTPLLLAALSGWHTVAEIMLANTPSRDWAFVSNNNGNTALQVASFFSESPKFIETLLADTLIRKTVNDKASNGRTALMLAVSGNKFENVQSLLASGADATLFSGETTAISIAEEKGFDAILGLLLGRQKVIIDVDGKGEEL